MQEKRCRRQRPSVAIEPKHWLLHVRARGVHSEGNNVVCVGLASSSELLKPEKTVVVAEVVVGEYSGQPSYAMYSTVACLMV